MGMHFCVCAVRVCEPMRDLLLTSIRAPFGLVTSYAIGLGGSTIKENNKTYGLFKLS